jgi:DNA polymerase III alpha subunit
MWKGMQNVTLIYRLPFSGLIAMNALYRPGPIRYIPSFVKDGEEKIEFNLETLKTC